MIFWVIMPCNVVDGCHDWSSL